MADGCSLPSVCSRVFFGHGRADCPLDQWSGDDRRSMPSCMVLHTLGGSHAQAVSIPTSNHAPTGGCFTVYVIDGTQGRSWRQSIDRERAGNTDICHAYFTFIASDLLNRTTMAATSGFPTVSRNTASRLFGVTLQAKATFPLYAPQLWPSRLAAQHSMPARPTWLSHLLGLAMTRAQPQETPVQHAELQALGEEGNGGFSRIMARHGTPANPF